MHQQSIMQNKKILVIEDNLTVQKLIKTLLEKNGFSVVCLASTDSAIEEMSTFQPDLIVLDYFLPDQDGGEFAVQLMEGVDTDLPEIVFVTALANGLNSRTLKMLKIGGKYYEYVAKDLVVWKLLPKIKKVLNISA